MHCTRKPNISSLMMQKTDMIHYKIEKEKAKYNEINSHCTKGIIYGHFKHNAMSPTPSKTPQQNTFFWNDPLSLPKKFLHRVGKSCFEYFVYLRQSSFRIHFALCNVFSADKVQSRIGHWPRFFSLLGSGPEGDEVL